MKAYSQIPSLVKLRACDVGLAYAHPIVYLKEVHLIASKAQSIDGPSSLLTDKHFIPTAALLNCAALPEGIGRAEGTQRISDILDKAIDLGATGHQPTE